MGYRNKAVFFNDKETQRLYDRYRRKADQHWEMAGLARQDGDTHDAGKHTAKAREYEALCSNLVRNNQN